MRRDCKQNVKHQPMLRLAIACASALLLPSLALAEVPAPQRPAQGAPLAISAGQLEFEFGSQDGDMVFPCRHKLLNPITQDWEVVCGDQAKPDTIRKYTVHLWVKTYTRPTPPKMSYEVLHWVTDHQAKPGSGSQYVGTTLWFRLREPSDLHSIDLAQDVESVNSLRTRILVKP